MFGAMKHHAKSKLKTKGNRMRRTVGVLGWAAMAVLLVASGCSTPPKSDSAILQGKWQGREIGGEIAGACRLTVAGTYAEFHGADTNEWYKGVFSLWEAANPREIGCLITACSDPSSVGKTIHAIYRIEAGTVVLAVNEPGNPEVPADFDAPGARRFEFRKK
jgi:uncharacterized protein (TIGR03067 family)